jgi:hypothetical protein
VCSLRLPIVVERGVDELLDDYVSGLARFGIGERIDEADGGQGDRLLDGADRAFVCFFGGDHPLRDCHIDLAGIC